MTPTQILALLVTANTILTVPAVPDHIGLPQIYVDITYALDLRLNEEIFEPNGIEFSGILNIFFAFTNETEYILLHCNKNRIHLNKIVFHGYSINTDHTQNLLNDILKIPLKNRVDIGFRYVLHIEYTGKINIEDPETGTGLFKSSYLDSYGFTHYLLVTQFAPTHARTVFPCFDEPAMKAVFSISFRIPTEFNVMFSTAVQDIIYHEKKKLKTVVFANTPPMSTYLVGFVVFDFTCTLRYINREKTLEICSRDDLHQKRKFALEITPKLLTEYNKFTNTYYRNIFGTLNIVAIPDSVIVKSREIRLLYDVMFAVPYFHPDVTKAWSLIMNTENKLLSDNTKDSNENLEVALGISRELAYRWFGNLISVNWWSQIFVNRGLAAFFETYITNEVMQSAENQFIVNILHKTLVHDALDNIGPLYYENDKHTEHIKGSYAEGLYNKGGIIMRMVRYFMGLENFRTGIRSYIKRHKTKNVGINDLWNALEECIDDSVSHMPAKLSIVMENWIKYKGYPILNVTHSGSHVIISQSKFVYDDDHLVNDQTKWYIPISYTTAKQPNGFQKTTPYTWLTPNEDYISVPLLEKNKNTNWVILNNNQTGYYRVYYDEKLLKGIKYALDSSRFESVPEINRAHLVDDFFNFARAGLMKYEDVFELIKFLEHDRSYYPWKAAMEGFGFILKRYGYTSDIGIGINSYVLKLMKNQFDEPISIVNRNDRIYEAKQQLIYDWVCRFDDERCTEKVVEPFRKFIDNGERPDTKWRYIVYCNGLKYSKTSTDWTSLYQLYLEAKGKEKEIIRSALACTKEDSHLKLYLEQTIGERPTLRFTDVIRIFIETENNAEAMNVALEFLIQEQGYIQERYKSTDLFEYIFEEIGERLEWPELEPLRGIIEKSNLTKNFKDYGAKALRAADESRIWANKHHDELWRSLHTSYLRVIYTCIFTVIVIIIVCIALVREDAQRQRRNQRPTNDIPMRERY